MFKKILIANRGEIACRVIKTAKRLGITTVAVYSDADSTARHVTMADEAYPIGPAPSSESYLDIDRILEACLASGAEAVHPGYGFLSENPAFVEAIEASGLTFVGPSADAIRAMGLKDAAKCLMEQAGVPVVPGYQGDVQDPELLAARANDIGYPILIKARAGGGGKGMRLVRSTEEFETALQSATREAEASFGDGRCLLEKYITTARHIEVQVFGDLHGNVVHLFERDCSLQRRHQKVIEEAPAPGMTAEIRAAMGDAAVCAAKAIGYVGAGTVEFIADVSEGLRSDRFYFMEMNTRLQVEHPVTEMIIGKDLVEWQLHIAAGGRLPASQDELGICGWAFEARIYAEDAAKGFLPATGQITHLSLPGNQARIDSGVCQGDEITPFYDPMIAKLIVCGDTRTSALRQLSLALRESLVTGVKTNIAFLAALADHPEFVEGAADTGLIDRHLSLLTAVPHPPIEAMAVAALEALGFIVENDHENGAYRDPWSSLKGWRLWSDAHHTAVLESDGKRIEIDIAIDTNGSYRIRGVDGEVLIEELIFDGETVRCRTPEQVFSAKVVHAGDAITVLSKGATYGWIVPDALATGSADDDAGDRVTAPMPGVIKVVDAKPGDQVIKDASVLVMEAMKMEHVLKAPRNGVVEDVFVEAGDQVQEGMLLVTFAEASA